MKLKPQFDRLPSEKRLYQLEVPVIGLTGGIATGKSTVSKYLASKGLPVIDADLLVKEVYQKPEVVNFISLNYPEVIMNGEIHFPYLREKVFSNPKVKAEVEKMIYSHLPEAFHSAWLKFKKPDFIIYDVPLLFEKGMGPLFDLTILVYAPRDIQKVRSMARDGMNEDLAEKLLNSQMDIEEKKKKAEIVIDNSQDTTKLAEGIDHFLQQVFDIS